MNATDYELVDAKAKIDATIRLLRDVSRQAIVDLGADEYLAGIHKLERYREDLWIS